MSQRYERTIVAPCRSSSMSGWWFATSLHSCRFQTSLIWYLRVCLEVYWASNSMSWPAHQNKSVRGQQRCSRWSWDYQRLRSLLCLRPYCLVDGYQQGPRIGEVRGERQGLGQRF